MSTNPVNELFTEKFRPKDLSNLIAPPRIKNELAKGLIQNLLLHGSAGNGKCVDENTIVTVKNNITGEISNVSFKDLIKIAKEQALEKNI